MSIFTMMILYSLCTTWHIHGFLEQLLQEFEKLNVHFQYVISLCHSTTQIAAINLGLGDGISRLSLIC